MNKVLVDRELLERAMYAKDGKELIAANRELRAILDKPAEAEGADLQRLAAEFDAAPDDAEWEPPHPIFQMARDLDRVTAALSAVTAERDRLLQELAKSETNTMTLMVKHFAGSMSSREQDRKLDECLSEGIALLKAERDRLLSDNASLRGSCKALGEENKQLKRENKRQGRTLAAMAAKEA